MTIRWCRPRAGAAGTSTAAGALRARAYVQNNEWRWEEPEPDSQALAPAARAPTAPPHERGEALLTRALNISNTGRFAEADRQFAAADAQVALSGDPVLA